MRDSLSDFLPILWGIWRFRWPALIAAWIFALLGWVFVDTMSVKYRASAKVYLDSNRVLRPLLAGMAVQPDLQQQVVMLSKTLLNRPNLERLVDDLGLADDAPDRNTKELIMESLSKKIKLTPDRRNKTLFDVTYAHGDRDKALRGVNSVLEIFTETTVGENRQDNEKALSFVDSQISDLEIRLLTSENLLSKFKRDNAENLPDELSGDFFQRFAVAEDRVRDSKLRLQEASNRRRVLARQLANEPRVSYPSGFGNHPLDQQITAATERLQSLQLRYTDQHPEIEQLRFDIDSLRRQKAANPNATLGGGGVASLAYQELRTMLAEAEAVVAENKARVTEYERQLTNMKETRHVLPEMEVELKKLTRNYGNLKEQYDSLQKKREAALLSYKLDDSGGVPFRIVDPVYAPIVPGEPKKKILNLIVLFASGLVGAGVAFMIHFFRPMFFDQKMLAQVTKLPVLGTVTMQRTGAAAHWFPPEIRKYVLIACFLPVGFLVVSLLQSWTPKKSITTFLSDSAKSDVSVASTADPASTDALQTPPTIISPEDNL